MNISNFAEAYMLSSFLTFATSTQPETQGRTTVPLRTPLLIVPPDDDNPGGCRVSMTTSSLNLPLRKRILQ